MAVKYITNFLIVLRAKLNEVSAGQWTDAQLYLFIYDAQQAVINGLFAKEMIKQLINPLYLHPSLQTIIATKSFNITSGTAEYSFTTLSLTDYLKAVMLVTTYAIGSNINCTQLSYSEAIWRKGNSFTAPTTSSPVYYINGNAIGFVPAPDATASSGATLKYYSEPPAIDSTHDILLGLECQNAMRNYAMALALQKDGRPQEATAYFELFETELNKL